MHDLSLAIRSLRPTPIVTVVALATLALGIAATLGRTFVPGDDQAGRP
jgi:hypothetical protein